MFKETDDRPTRAPEAQQEKWQSESCAMRALTVIEMQDIERKSAEELHYLVRSFVAFPAPQNFQKIQEASARYMQAWMNGRRRVLD